MKVRNSLRSLKNRHRDCRIVRRKGRVYVINKTQRRFKARQGQNHQARRCAKKAALRGGFFFFRGRRIRVRWRSGIVALIVDHLAIIRKAANRHQLDLAAQLQNLGRAGLERCGIVCVGL